MESQLPVLVALAVQARDEPVEAREIACEADPIPVVALNVSDVGTAVRVGAETVNVTGMLMFGPVELTVTLPL